MHMCHKTFPTPSIQDHGSQSDRCIVSWSPLTRMQVTTPVPSVSNVRDSARSVGGERASSSFAMVPAPDMMRLSPKIRLGWSRPRMVRWCNPSPISSKIRRAERNHGMSVETPSLILCHQPYHHHPTPSPQRFFCHTLRAHAASRPFHVVSPSDPTRVHTCRSRTYHKIYIDCAHPTAKFQFVDENPELENYYSPDDIVVNTARPPLQPQKSDDLPVSIKRHEQSVENKPHAVQIASSSEYPISLPPFQLTRKSWFMLL